MKAVENAKNDYNDLQQLRIFGRMKMSELPRDEFLRKMIKHLREKIKVRENVVLHADSFIVDKTLFKKYIEEDKNQCEHYIKELIPYHGTEEGAICNRDGCEGVLQIKAESYTRCLQSEDVFLGCPECEWSSKDE